MTPSRASTATTCMARSLAHIGLRDNGRRAPFGAVLDRHDAASHRCPARPTSTRRWLVAAAVAGDDDAFSALADRYRFVAARALPPDPRLGPPGRGRRAGGAAAGVAPPGRLRGSQLVRLVAAAHRHQHVHGHRPARRDRRDVVRSARQRRSRQRPGGRGPTPTRPPSSTAREAVEHAYLVVDPGAPAEAAGRPGAEGRAALLRRRHRRAPREHRPVGQQRAPACPLGPRPSASPRPGDGARTTADTGRARPRATPGRGPRPRRHRSRRGHAPTIGGVTARSNGAGHGGSGGTGHGRSTGGLRKVKGATRSVLSLRQLPHRLQEGTAMSIISRSLAHRGHLRRRRHERRSSGSSAPHPPLSTPARPRPSTARAQHRWPPSTSWSRSSSRTRTSPGPRSPSPGAAASSGRRATATPTRRTASRCSRSTAAGSAARRR